MRYTRFIFSILTAFCFLTSQFSYADCDFKTGITPGPNKTFIYTEACHQKVGELVQDNTIKTQQLEDFSKALTLKDLAIQTADKRADAWMTTSGTLENRLQTVDTLQSRNNTIHFVLGVVTTIAAVWVAAKAIGK